MYVFFVFFAAWLTAKIELYRRLGRMLEATKQIDEAMARNNSNPSQSRDGIFLFEEVRNGQQDDPYEDKLQSL